jgi:putative tryptophan/tyrosine transport system substrate-binding protein
MIGGGTRGREPMSGMRRRDFVGLLGGAAAAWPLVARAQQPAMPVIGFLSSATAATFTPYISGFRLGLQDTGYIEGRNVAIEYRWVEGQYDRLLEQAADLARQQVAIIVSSGGAVAALAAKTATTTIPIVFVIGDDPLRYDLVTSLNRPGGNITGLSLFISTLMAKRLELLKMIPATSAIAMFVNPNNPNADLETRNMQEAALTSARELHIIKVSNTSEIDAGFATLVQQHIGALLVGTDTFFFSQGHQIITLAARYQIPTIYFVHALAAAGGLLSYGPDFVNEWRQAGIYAGRILKGTKPTDLPILQPTKFELVINLKTAKALGIEVPPTLLARADEVIE